MSDLVRAIEAEARGAFQEALDHYARLAESGPPLDRIGIHQALARCLEKLGRLPEAGAWRRRAGQGYLALGDGEMPRDEGQYLALVEYRNAVQDLQGDPSLPEAAKEYAAVLKDNFADGAEGPPAPGPRRSARTSWPRSPRRKRGGPTSPGYPRCARRTSGRRPEARPCAPSSSSGARCQGTTSSSGWTGARPRCAPPAPPPSPA